MESRPQRSALQRVNEADHEQQRAITKSVKRQARIARWKQFWWQYSPASLLRHLHTHTHTWRGRRGPGPESTSDVYAPLRRGPTNRSGAVALEEPHEPHLLDVQGKLQK